MSYLTTLYVSLARQVYLHLLIGLSTEVKMAVFWVVAQCSLVEVYRRFRGACCLYHQGDLSLMVVNFYQTTLRNNPEDGHLHTSRRENLKSQ
jgi:hypothetical protein